MEKVIENSLGMAVAAIMFLFILGKFQEFLMVISCY